MAADRLSALQRRVLDAVAGFEPPFTLTGGSALAGFYLFHRATRDLDLIWRHRERLERIADEMRARLRGAGLEVTDLQSADTFHRFRVAAGAEVTLLDLAAEPTGPIQPPLQIEMGSALLRVDTPHEILVNKLAALLGRSELRDLQDVKALVEGGEDLDRALREAPKKDAGFSPLTLAWLLRSCAVEPLGRALGWSAGEIAAIERFKESLIDRLLAGSGGAGAPPHPPGA